MDIEEKIKTRLCYNPDSGIVTRKIDSRNKKYLAGDICNTYIQVGGDFG